MERKFGWICAVAAGIFVLGTSHCEAQLGRQLKPIQNTGRFLGAGYGLGYHRCNPGHDTSYYNPWNTKNSFLISQSPEYLARFSQQRHQTPLDLLYNQQQGYSAYRGQSVNNFGQSNYGSYAPPASQGEQIDADFQPVRNRDDAQRNDAKQESANDFVPSKTQPKDQFESEADALNGDRSRGGFDDLKEALDKELKEKAGREGIESAGRLDAARPHSVFLNSSFSDR